MKSDAKALALLSLVILATGLPFVNRPYFIDDYYFVAMAKGILQNPWRPYDFKSDDAGKGNAGWERGHFPRMVNPPLFHYFLAGVIALFGDATWKLRTASLLFSFIALFSMYFLGKRFVPDPLLPALLMAVSPAYWLTSYSLLIDSALVAGLLASLWIFVVGHERRKIGWIVLSGILMGLTMLVKYFGVIVVVLALTWQLLDPKRRAWKPGYLAFFCFVGIQILWAAWNITTYGQSHFLAALPRGMESPSIVAWAQKGLILGSFIGGSLIFVLACPAILWRVSKGWVGGIAALALVLFLGLSSKMGGFEGRQAFFLALFVAGTVSYLVLAGRLINLENKNHLFLMLWVLFGIGELVVVMPWTAARYLLCIAPAMCWIFALFLEQLQVTALWNTVLGFTTIFGLLLAQADYVQAHAIVSLANQLQQKRGELQTLAPPERQRWYYLSDTFDGSQPYMQPIGWENVFPRYPLKRGDLFLRAYYRRSSYWNVDEQLRKYKPIFAIEIRSRNLLRVMDVPASAGFYASVWGALPWTVTNHPVERFELYQAMAAD